MSLTKILEQKVEVSIENVVATTSLNHTINIKSMAKRLHAKYDPDRFPGAIVRLDNPRAVLIVFKSGSIVCTGTKSEEMAQKAVHQFVLGFNNKISTRSAFKPITIVNMVASCNIGSKIHLEQAARNLPRSMYEPDQFPAIIHRLSHPKTVALIFASGKIVCVGAKTTKHLYDSVNTVNMDLEKRGLTWI